MGGLTISALLSIQYVFTAVGVILTCLMDPATRHPCLWSVSHLTVSYLDEHKWPTTCSANVSALSPFLSCIFPIGFVLHIVSL